MIFVYIFNWKKDSVISVLKYNRHFFYLESPSTVLFSEDGKVTYKFVFA